MNVTDYYAKQIKKCAYNHCLFAIQNKKYFLDQKENFSVIQYSNPKIIQDQIKFNDLVVNKLIDFDKDAAYLNFGVGPGFLELCNTYRKSKLHISTVEWDVQLPCFSVIRKHFNIELNYTCNNIFDDDFEIKNCKTYFNYIILQRFFPVYKFKENCDRIKFILDKLAKYAQNIIILESDVNWTKEQKIFLKSEAKKNINISGDWNCWIIESKKIYENV